ncbi:MAG: TetR/AcrR family transcriptional regulator [Clostridia bacterium]|nr:TetR/AcrR family transcriptional regulator [Clostridia bacterium]
MDRRQKRTRRAIFDAFCSLLERKRYDHITVQDIIDEADVGRTTFYSHFETKDLLLDALCEELFCHIFEHDSCPFSGNDNDLEGKLSHILWHIRDSKKDIGVLISDSSDLFMGYFKRHLRAIFELHIDSFHINVPKDFLLNHLVGSFSDTVRWWMREGMKTPPERVAGYFMQMTEKH